MKNKNMKRGITLIEITLAIVLIAIILGITIPKLMSNSDRAEIQATISSDVKSIVQSALLWKKSAALADGNFENIDPTALNSRLPSNMVVDTAKGIIYSSALRTGLTDGAFATTGIDYTVAYSLDPADSTVATGSFSIIMDATPSEDPLNWDAKTRAYAIDVFTDTIADLSNNQVVGENHTVAFTALGTGTGKQYDCSDPDIVCFHNVNLNN